MTRTSPSTPSTIRTSSGTSVRGGMKSTSFTVPLSVANVVSSTSVSGTYRRSTRRTSSTGAIIQRPWSGVPRSAAKQAPESKRGKHSQSIEPSRPTSAAVWQSPIKA